MADNMAEAAEDDLPEVELVRRVAFDIGSGATKAVIADVDIGSSCIVDVLFGEEVPVSFSMDWKQSTDGALSAAIQDKGLQTLNTLARKATALGATQSAAIATEVFRKATNGESYLRRIREELGLVVQLVPQETEARLGFLSAAALSAVPREELIAWDSGGASFQITRQAPPSDEASSRFAAPLEAYLGALGVGVATAMCVEEVQGAGLRESPSPNPVSEGQAAELVRRLQARLSPVPSWLSGSMQVVAIGGRNSMFYLATDVIKACGEYLSQTAIHKDQVWRALLSVSDSTDDDLAARYCTHALSDPPSFVAPKLALLFAVMDFCDIPHIRFQLAIGSCAGMLVSESLFAA